jgi:hypothetical protein
MTFYVENQLSNHFLSHLQITATVTAFSQTTPNSRHELDVGGTLLQNHVQSPSNGEEALATRPPVFTCVDFITTMKLYKIG